MSGSGVLATAQVGTGAWSCLGVPVVTKPSDACTPPGACAPAGRGARAPKGGVTGQDPPQAGGLEQGPQNGLCSQLSALAVRPLCRRLAVVWRTRSDLPPFPFVVFVNPHPRMFLVVLGRRRGETDRQQCERHTAWFPLHRPAPGSNMQPQYVPSNH